MHLLDADLNAVLLVVAFVLSTVAVVQAAGRSVLAWACAVGFFAVAWNAVAVAAWF